MSDTNQDNPHTPEAQAEPSGPRAFPVVGVDGVWDPGMTLRDYFAAKAMAAWIGAIVQSRHNWNPIDFAVEGYKCADAMIAARKAVQP